MTARIRILHALGSAGIGGVETFVLGVAEALDRDRFTLAVCILGEEGELATDLRARGVEVRCLNSPRLGLQAMGKLHGWIRQWRPCVLHANLGGRRLRWLARSAGVHSIICHAHGPPDELWQGVQQRDPRLRSTVRSAYGAGSDLVLACSEWLRDSLCSIAPELSGRTSVLHCGVDVSVPPLGSSGQSHVRALLGLPVTVPVLGFVGRLVPQKGIDDLARVAHGWLVHQPDGHFVALGDGPLRPLLEVVRDRSPTRVHLVGDRQDAASLMGAFDVLVVTSRWEPFGIVNLEAMAAGVPVVAFDVGGIAEVVDHCRTGLLVRSGDVEGMRRALGELMTDPERRATMGEAGRARARDQFSLSVMARLLGEHYERLADA